MVATRHEFLAEMHRILKPLVYLEIGVQHGHSLALANGCRNAHGIDPDPQIQVPVTGRVIKATSDEYFMRPDAIGVIDLAFIDGMHLVEYALRDFMNVELRSHSRGYIIFDDVLPRNETEASRTPCPGDWTGDVWKIHDILYRYRPDLSLTLVDVDPTGLLLVTDLDGSSNILRLAYPNIILLLTLEYATNAKFQDTVNRVYALNPDVALNRVKTRLDY